MATIDITRAHALAKDEARKKAEELAKSLESKLGISWKWNGDSLEFSAPSGAAKGTKGDVTVTDGNVRVRVDLPMLLRMLKGTIETKGSPSCSVPSALLR